jgi:hypothetical protein
VARNENYEPICLKRKILILTECQCIVDDDDDFVDDGVNAKVLSMILSQLPALEDLNDAFGIAAARLISMAMDYGMKERNERKDSMDLQTASIHNLHFDF